MENVDKRPRMENVDKSKLTTTEFALSELLFLVEQPRTEEKGVMMRGKFHNYCNCCHAQPMI